MNRMMTIAVLVAAGIAFVGCAPDQGERVRARDGTGPNCAETCPVVPGERVRAQNGSGPNFGQSCRQNSAACACIALPGASTRVDQKTADALRAALDDERRSQDFYNAVMIKHGEVRPFVNIVRAEERHEQVVKTLMERHGVDVPPRRVMDIPEVPVSVAECATVAAKLERDNIALYDRTMVDTKEQDIKKAFANLRGASLNNHLPAFERWAR